VTDVDDLSAMQPSATQRFLLRQRVSPCRRLTTLMRPSYRVRLLRNQRFFCSRLRSVLLLERDWESAPVSTPFS
jgi:hypothetical protein